MSPGSEGSVTNTASPGGPQYPPPEFNPPPEEIAESFGEILPVSVLWEMRVESTAAQTTPAVLPQLGWVPARQAQSEAEPAHCDTNSQVAKSARPITTGQVGTNADLFPDILSLYVPEGSVVADVTFGKGVFWRNVDTSKYVLKASDLMDDIDFRSLPYEDGSIDALVLDPPYMHDGKTVHKSLNKNYRNNDNPLTSHASVIRLYCAGILEAARVLKKKGVIIVKCQDETESGKQRLSHVELIQLLELLGFEFLDLFVLLRNGQPMMREKYQKSARKNHSYAIVARFNR